MTAAGPLPVQAPRLRQQLGLISITVSGVGIVLGPGIYVLVGEAAGDVGYVVQVTHFSIFAVGGILVFAAFMDRAAALASSTVLPLLALSFVLPPRGQRQQLQGTPL
ncbi:MAG: hypothetical protein GEU80_02155 [Dehalococcoidia bacterium]|nr:hypothetical protein [Dehalococcoidia bacterium]